MSGGEKKKANRKTYERGDRKLESGRESLIMCLSRAIEVVLTFQIAYWSQLTCKLCRYDVCP